MEGLPSLQISQDFVTPALAFGAYFPVPQLESSGLKVGPFSVRASANAAIGFDDNVTLSATNKTSSMFYSLAPSIALGLEGADQRYYAVYRGNYGEYSTSAIASYADHSFGLNAHNVWTTRFTTTANYELFLGRDPVGTTGTTRTAANRWHTHRVRGVLSYGAPEARAHIDVNVGYLKREYTNNRDVTALGDYDQWDAGGNFAIRIAPKTRLSLEMVHSEISHPQAPLLDASENRYLVGVVWDALAKTQGRASAGYMKRNPENAASEPFSAPTYEVGIRWSALTYSVVNVTSRRTFAEALEPGSNFIVLDSVHATWTHSWQERTRTTLGYLFGKQSHQGLGRADTYHTLEARASYAFQPRWRVGAQFRHDSRSSPDSVFDYKRNLTLLTVETAL